MEEQMNIYVIYIVHTYIHMYMNGISIWAPPKNLAVAPIVHISN